MSKSSSESLVSRNKPYRAKLIEFISCIYNKSLACVLWFIKVRKWSRFLFLLVFAIVLGVIGYFVAETIISKETLPAINMVLDDPIFQNVRDKLSLIQKVITTLLQASVPMFFILGVASITFSYINKHFQEFDSKASDERKQVALDQPSLATNTESKCANCKKMEMELSELKERIGLFIDDLATVFMKFVGIGTFPLSVAMVAIGSLGLGAILGIKYKFAKMLNEAFQVNFDTFTFDLIALGSLITIFIGISVLLIISFDRKKAKIGVGCISLAIGLGCQVYLIYGSITDLSTDCKLANQMLEYYYKLQATTGEVGTVPQIPLCGLEVAAE